MGSAPWLGRQRWAGEASGRANGSSRLLQSCWVLHSLTAGRQWGGLGAGVDVNSISQRSPSWVKCCWQHWGVNYLETGVKAFYKYGRGRRDFPGLPQWGGHRVCPGSPSSAAWAALQLCQGTPRGLCGCPLWDQSILQPCPDQLGTSQPSHCALLDGEGFIQGGRGTPHPLRAALPANTNLLSAPGLSQS